MCLVLNQEIRTRSKVSSFSHMDAEAKKGSGQGNASVMIELGKGDVRKTAWPTQ